MLVIRHIVASLAISGVILVHPGYASTPEDVVADLLAVDRDGVWAAQAQPATLRSSSDRGHTWTTVLVGMNSGFVDISIADSSGKILRAAEREGIIWGSEDSGGHWDRLSLVPHPVTAATWSAAGVGLAIGFDGLISRSADAGLTWTAQPSPVVESLHAVLSVGESAWVVGDNGTVLRSLDAGLTWKRVIVPTKEPIFCVATSAAVVWIGGRHGTLLRSTDDGTPWKTFGSPSRETIRGVASVGGGRVAIAAMDGVWVGTDDKWTRLRGGNERDWSVVTRLDDQLLLAGGTGGHVETLPVAP